MVMMKVMSLVTGTSFLVLTMGTQGFDPHSIHFKANIRGQVKGLGTQRIG